MGRRYRYRLAYITGSVAWGDDTGTGWHILQAPCMVWGDDASRGWHILQAPWHGATSSAGKGCWQFVVKLKCSCLVVARTNEARSFVL